MKIYSIVRIGNEYVVRAGEKSILKVASRRRAAQLVTDAVELLDSQLPRNCRRKPPASHQSPVIPASYLIPPKFLDDSGAIPLCTAAGHLPPTGG